MGSIFYGGRDEPIQIEDRTLSHLKIVIATKLRRQESFTFSWVHPEPDSEGRSTIWLHPAIPLRFVFESREPAELNLQWIDRLMQSANSTGGITLVDEAIEDPESTTPFNS